MVRVLGAGEVMTARGELPPDEAAYDGAVHAERIAREFDKTDAPELHYELQRDGRWHTVAEDRRAGLPDGVEHGSARAVRLGCSCKRCLDRAARMRRRGWRL